jgi:hypothetical protein
LENPCSLVLIGVISRLINNQLQDNNNMCGFSFRIQLIYLFILLDIIFNSISPSAPPPYLVGLGFMGYDSDCNLTCKSGQILCIAIVGAFLYNLISKTLMFRAGLFMGVFKMVKFYALIAILHLLLVIGCAVFRSVRTVSYIDLYCRRE